MRWLSFTHDGTASFGFVDADERIVDVGRNSGYPGLKEALAAGSLAELASGGSTDAPRIDQASVTFLPPIVNPDKILCVGLNYRAHQLETGRGGETNPTIFVRFAAAQVGHKGNMIRPLESNTLDFEGEIALIIGERGRRIPQDRFIDHVFGFSCYNDGSVREYQRHTSQFTPGKNFIGTGGFGPWIMTTDEVGDLDEMELTTRLNGQEMQRAKSSDLVFGFAELVNYCSTFTELVPGDVIVTGTPGGVGAARNPPVFMDEGDTISVSVSPIGSLDHSVIVG